MCVCGKSGSDCKRVLCESTMSTAYVTHTDCIRTADVACVKQALDVFDLKLTDRCVSSKYGTARAIRERTSPYAFSRRTLMSYTNPSSSRTHLFTLACHVTECNRSLCG